MQNKGLMSLTLDEVESKQQELKELIDLSGCLNRLINNSDFKKVILEGYLKDESSRLVGLLGEPQFNNSDKKSSYREDIMERMHGIARLSEYLRMMSILGEKAKKELEELNAAKETFLNEEQEV